MKIYLNHLGYETASSKKVIIKAKDSATLTTFSIHNFDTGEVVYSAPLNFSGPVAEWKDWEFWSGDFSDFTTSGTWYISLPGQTSAPSAPFQIAPELYQERILKNLLYFFKTQRASGPYQEADKAVPFVGKRKGTVDVSGGWYDASGDYSKYLTHLCYSNYMNPQQIPMTVWILLQSFDNIKDKLSKDDQKVFGMLYGEEAVFGADFLVRMQDEDGYFYTNVFDRWSKDVKQREICSFVGIRGKKNENYQAGYRQGAGVAIAALARLSAIPNIKGDFSAADYLKAAEKGFKHLEVHNIEYLNDGKENVIDDYCALLAASELYKATKNKQYLTAARKRAENLVNRVSTDSNYSGWLKADDDGTRPYFHAAEAGLPILALNRYTQIEKDSNLIEKTRESLFSMINFELTITNEENNPFGYPRQYVKSVSGEKRGAFFIPHENETGYWWQGENARLASLSAAALLAGKPVLEWAKKSGRLSDKEAKAFASQLNRFCQDPKDWILGQNPYDVCFLKGTGRNTPDYHWSAPGGICNGITAGVDNEEDIDYMPPAHAGNGAMSWRWVEQWLPHASWFLLAVTSTK